MAIKYEWKIEDVETAEAENGLTDVIKRIHWRLNAVDGEYTSTAYGCVELGDPDSDSFIGFDSLTKTQVINWVKARLEEEESESSEAELKVYLKNTIDKKKNPKLVSKIPNSLK